MYSKILSFISIKDKQSNHKVIFINQREISVQFTGSIPYWYNIETELHPSDSIYAWRCVGTHEQINAIAASIKGSSQIIISTKTFNFFNTLKASNVWIEQEENSIANQPGIFEKYKTELSSCTEPTWMHEVGQFSHSFLTHSFCNHISGIQASDLASGTFSPAGYWDEGELLGYFEKHVIEVIERLKPTISLRGDGHQNSKVVTGFKGICQNFPAEWDTIEILLYNLENTTILASLGVNLNNGWGEWDMTVPNCPSKGIIEVRHKNNIVGTNKFYLLLDIKIDINIDSHGSIFQDAYGRKISSEKKHRESSAPQSLNWISDYEQKNSLLCDDLVKIIQACGTNLLVQDPFLFGKIEDGKKVSKGSLCTLNALAISIVTGQLKKLTFLLDEKKLKLDSLDKDNYENFLISFFQPLKKFGLEKVQIAYAQNSFHDRYFLGMADLPTLYHISKSLNGFLESDDLTIYLYDGDKRKLLSSQILYRLNNSTKVDLI